MSATAISAQPTGSLLDAIQSMLALTAVGLFVLAFTLQPFRIPSASMEPTLLVGDFLLVQKDVGPSQSPLLPPAGLRHGDIIVFHDPVDHARYLIKRIVAIPGDRLHLHAGRLVLNGQLAPEPYALLQPSPPDSYRDNFPNAAIRDLDVDPTWRNALRRTVDHGDLRVPPGSFFVMGDNRNDSLDSRYWGFVPAAAIVGRPLLIYLSLRLPDADAAPPTRHIAFPRLLARWNRTLTLVR